jgi:hypothetical protein
MATSEQENVQPSRANYIAGILFDEAKEGILE